MAQTNPIITTARELVKLLDEQHAKRVGEFLGCEVTILRREPMRTHQGRFIGLSEPVFQMPAEFIEQAQALGLLAEAK